MSQKIAYIFPGQGSQYVGMGKDLYDKSAVAREMFDSADETLGFALSKICFYGPEEELKQTKNTQPAIFLHSVILTKLMEQNDISMVAGHSLGEYTAVVSSGAMSFENGLRLVRLRGELMQRAGHEQQGTMAAVIGLDEAAIEDICRSASIAGIVQVANFNSPGQIVISGSIQGVRKGMELAKARGAKMVKELVVSGAFHSPLMKSAHDELESALHSTEMFDAQIPIVANVTGKPVQKASEICTLLGEQLTNAVRWDASVRTMVAAGITTFVEVGPGKVLQGLVKRIEGMMDIRGVDKFEDIEKLVLA